MMNAREVIVLAELYAKPEHRDELSRLLFEMIERTRVAPECFSYDLFAHTDDEDVFLLFQTWGNREAFETNWLHIDSPKLKTHEHLLRGPSRAGS